MLHRQFSFVTAFVFNFFQCLFPLPIREDDALHRGVNRENSFTDKVISINNKINVDIYRLVLKS